ncbi:hypothetical protein H0H10_35080 [Streptomyces sp. TRM S81-3]|uniref:Uncharacterized protein n=1 Tax=Streptomyces griseicoloratus TaxID=2752516 RepID=A0A926QTP9_9ACTN|nr:hypothetical protein [Streptomyces griseicoloratus]MBD0424329.1 hypothetical protein [Streptomyces griseicoloratus]
MALPALVLLPFLAAFVAVVFDDSEYPLGGGPEKTPCADVLRFGGAALPPGAQPVGACTRQGWQDLYYRAVFRMPRADVLDWLAHTYPAAPDPETESCADADADMCLGLGYSQGLPDGVGADSVRVSVVHEDAGTSLVRFSASTV